MAYDFHTVAVNEYGQSETSDVTEQRPVRRPSKSTTRTGLTAKCLPGRILFATMQIRAYPQVIDLRGVRIMKMGTYNDFSIIRS